MGRNARLLPPPPEPDVADLAPTDPMLTAYDEESNIGYRGVAEGEELETKLLYHFLLGALGWKRNRQNSPPVGSHNITQVWRSFGFRAPSLELWSTEAQMQLSRRALSFQLPLGCQRDLPSRAFIHSKPSSGLPVGSESDLVRASSTNGLLCASSLRSPHRPNPHSWPINA